MMGRMMRAAIMLLALAGGVASAQGVLLPPEQTGKIDRYDSVRKVLYIEGREYLLTGQAAQAAAEAHAKRGGTALRGRNVAFETGDAVNGLPTITQLSF